MSCAGLSALWSEAMASGYEKADCGVDPNTGWRKPSASFNFWITVFGVTGSVLLLGLNLFVVLRLLAF